MIGRGVCGGGAINFFLSLCQQAAPVQERDHRECERLVPELLKP
jgi:hypothetical protein